MVEIVGFEKVEILGGAALLALRLRAAFSEALAAEARGNLDN